MFSNLNTLGILNRIVYLHTYMAVYQLNLAKMATIVRSLSLLQKVETISSNRILSSLLPSSSKQLIYSVHHSDRTLDIQYLSTIVVNILFKTLVDCMAGSPEQLKQWYEAYLDIMTLPAFADICVGLAIQIKDANMSMKLMRAQLNVMQSTFSALQCKQNCDEMLTVGKKFFFSLFSSHFKENGEVSACMIVCMYFYCYSLQLKDKCPHLAEVCQVALNCFKTSSSENDRVNRFIEKIFSHFIPVDSTNCSSDDFQWFLFYANSQRQWLSRASEISGGFTQEQMTIHIFKLYLSRILGKQSGGSTASCDPLALYNDTVSFCTCMGQFNQYITIFGFCNLFRASTSNLNYFFLMCRKLLIQHINSKPSCMV